MLIRLSRLWLSLPFFTGCHYLPKPYYFTAPENEPNPAYVRIVDFNQHADIYQYENGVRCGGGVRSGPLPFIRTQDIGMPKAGQDLTSDYYETKVRPGIETQIGTYWEGSRTRSCFVTTVFTPQPGRYYQFEMTSGSRGTCKLHPSLIERDQQGIGWHLTPNLEVTYPHEGPRATPYYGDERYKDCDDTPLTPGQPPY